MLAASDVEITMERRGKVLQVRAYLNWHGLIVFACRQDYPADTATEDEILGDITKELELALAN
jgi:hypothetical protein